MSKKKLVYLLLSVVMAFALWLYVITVVSPESEATFENVPVVMKNQEQLAGKELMLIMDEEPTVTLKLVGNRIDLARLNKSNITVMADLSRIAVPGEYELTYDVSYPAEVGGAIGLESKKPSTLKVNVERRIVDKPVEIEIVENGNVDADCIVQDQLMSTQEVLISGPKSVVDKITVARIEVDMEGRDNTFTEQYKYTLCDAEGNPVDAKLVETNVAAIELTTVVQRIKEIPLRLIVEDGGGATWETSNIVIEPESIKVVGSEEDLADLDSLLLGTINLAEYEADATEEFVINLPAGVKDLGGNETAKVTIQFPDLKIVELTVTNLSATNIPEGMKADILSQSVTVKLRGPVEKMSNITADDVKIVVDLTGKSGNVNAEAQVVITNEEFASAGALGTYSVTVSLTQKK